jgi:hypothetical protein
MRPDYSILAETAAVAEMLNVVTSAPEQLLSRRGGVWVEIAVCLPSVYSHPHPPTSAPTRFDQRRSGLGRGGTGVSAGWATAERSS